MKAGLGLNMSVRQELKLQPRQILCNELLTLPLLDLEVALQNELEENIFLEAEERTTPLDLMPSPSAPVEMTPPGGEPDSQNFMDTAPSGDTDQLSNLLNYLSESRSSVSPSGGDAPEAYDIEARLSLPGTWRQLLAESLRLERMTDDVAAAAEYLVGCLDERGYLNETLDDVARATQVDKEAAEEALEILQRVAPPGVGARDLRERLLLRCQALPEPNDILERILTRGYDDLIQGRFEILKRKLSLSDDDLRGAIEDLKELARDALPIEDTEPAAGVVPDASVYKEGGRWKVRLHDESVPRLRLSSYAAKIARETETLTPEAKEYLNRSLTRAKWMMEALDQRRKTLRNILEAVVERQEDFLERGMDAMVPLRQEDIAEVLHLHASTVSRAVQEKYVDTPHGLVPLKHFFPRGVSTDVGQQARNSVQDRLAALVAGEDTEKPLSDDVLVDMLAAEGIRLSRRTVCKYRDELGIPPATRRKGLARVMGNKGK